MTGRQVLRAAGCCYNHFMTWVLAGFLMFIFSVVNYLALRKSSLLKTPTQLNNLAMFALPLFFYLLVLPGTRDSLAITPFHFFIIVVMSVFFSYLGNVFSLKSIELAPNPGYSLILSKSYVVLTTLVAVLAFHSVLTIRAAASGFNYFMQLGFELAPNIGYINAINAASIAAVSVFSMLLFKDELTVRKLIGIFGVTAGLVLLVV